MDILILVAGLIVTGLFVVCTVVLTFDWLRKKIKKRLENKKIKKVAYGKVSKLVKECSNEISLDDLEKYDSYMVSVNDKDEVEDLELIKNDGSDDQKINEMIKDGDGMVVITA